MAISNWFVDPNAGNDTTGNGTIGTPWKSVQKALNTITRNATDGDQVNVKAGAADVLGAALSLATYGTPDGGAPLYLRGYTSAAGDGGIGEIDGAGSYTIFSAGSNANKSFIHIWDMKLGNCGASQLLRLHANSSIVNCELHTCTANQAVYFHNINNRVINCLFHTLSGASNVYVASTSTHFVGCTFRSSGGTAVLNLTGQSCVVAYCYFDISADTSLSAIVSTNDPLIMNCTVWSAVAQTVAGLQIDPAGIGVVLNTLVSGYSGAGGVGYQAGGNVTVSGGNGYYGNTTNETLAGKASISLRPAAALAAAPFVDASNDDFNLTPGGAAVGAAWPQVAVGMPATTSAGDIGAAQGGGGGGGGPVVGSRIVRGLGAI